MAHLNQESRQALLYLHTLFNSGYDFYHPCSHNHIALRKIRFLDKNRHCLANMYLSAQWYCNNCRLASNADFQSFCDKVAAFHVTKDREIYAICSF